jgi:hypothetical protein
MFGRGNGLLRLRLSGRGWIGTALLVAVAFAWAPPLAAEGITVEFNELVADAVKDFGKDPEAERQRLEKDFNDGLRELSKTDANAKALYESGQKVRIVCFGDPDAVSAGIKTPPAILGTLAETAGAFDATGQPAPGGTVVIAIDCDVLAANGFDKPVVFEESLYGQLIHELLHAANAARRHPPDSPDLYRAWQRAFAAALARARAAGATAPPPTAPPGTAAPGTPVPPADPLRVRDRGFSNAATAAQARELVRKAEEATRRCDMTAFQEAIRTLIDLEQKARSEAGRFRRAQSEAADARARALDADAAAIFGLRLKLEEEFSKNCATQRSPATGLPPLIAPPEPGPTDRRSRVWEEEYYSNDAADAARAMLRKAAEAERNCDRQAYLDAIAGLRRAAEATSQRATNVFNAMGGTDRAAYVAGEIEGDARRLRAQADKLQRELEARFGERCPPGAALDRGAQAGTGYSFNIQPGGTVMWTPQIPAGTVITQLGVPGTELPLVWSPGTLAGGGIRIGLDVPLTDAFLGRNWTLMMRGSYNYADGRANGAIPAGGPNVARTYFFPNPSSGVTGIFYGMTGMAIDIETRTQAVGLDVLLKTPVFQGRANGWNYSVNVGAGPTYRYAQTNHAVSERNLTFDDIWSRRELDTNDHFFGARFSAGVKVESGRWQGSLNVHVAPGVVISDARATQRNVCALCLPSDKDFMLGVQGSRTGFGVLTGIGASVGYNLTRAIRIGAFARFDYSSRQSVWRNPASPLQQPIRLGVDDAMSAAFGIRLGIRL